jgi:putative two-component system response regulator
VTTADRILIVDDEQYIARLLQRALSAQGHDCTIASSFEDAVEKIQLGDYALILSDINMPGRSGLDLLAWAGEHDADLAVIMITGAGDREMAAQALRLGAFGYVSKPFDLNEVMFNVANALERRRLARSSRVVQARLEEEVRLRTAEIREREEEIALRLVATTEYWDSTTAAHVRRIGLFSALLAEAAGWDPQVVDDLRVAAMMHDIGKIAMPLELLRKPGPLTPDEFEVLKRHTTIGARILMGSTAPVVELAAEIALSHHERWDGTGYPHGLAGQAIPMAARIVGIVDAYDVLSHSRPYKLALPEEEVIARISKDRGTHFEPFLVDLLHDRLPELRRIMETVTAEQAAATWPAAAAGLSASD